MLIDEIKKANIEALKSHDNDARASLSVAINRYMLINIENKKNNKETTDADIIKILSKLVKELDEEILGNKQANRLDAVKGLEKQKEIISKFLPKFLSEEEIKKEIAALTDKSIPSVMKHFKEKFPGKCDMAVVSKIARGQ